MTVIRDYIEVVADAFNITPAELTSDCRHRRFSVPRQVFCALVYENLGISPPGIGRLIGRDHTSVAHAIRRFSDHEADPEYREKIDRARLALSGGVFKSRRPV